MTGYPGKIPVAILTGFLGSGKTSVLNRLVRHPGMARSLVVINEFGDIGLDHELVERPSGDVVLLQSGCLCCTLRSDLSETLCSVLQKAERGEIVRFDRVVIETTGLAEPEPILQALMAEPSVAGRFELGTLVATVDALHGDASLERHVEAVKQVAVADRVLITKVDLAASAAVETIERRVRALNPLAPMAPLTLETELDPSLLWGGDLNAGSSRESATECLARGFMGGGDSHWHDHGIRSISLAYDTPIPAEVLDRCLVSLLNLRGPDLLRFKAIVNVAELSAPLVLHGVQHVMHPPLALKEWPSEDRRTRMVFITCGLDEEALRAALAELGERDGAGASPQRS
jgi:G3E family GTPase